VPAGSAGRIVLFYPIVEYYRIKACQPEPVEDWLQGIVILQLAQDDNNTIMNYLFDNSPIPVGR